jgi:tetratricopeptide (TPR) repeat protein
VEAYQESFDLAMQIGDRPLAAVAAFSLGNAHLGLRDLDEAERWYSKSLELRAEGDVLGRAISLGQLGHVALERLKEARKAKKPESELRRHLNEALRSHHHSLEMTPPDAIGQLAVVHNQLGWIHDEAGDLDRALHHYRESIRFEEVQGNLYGAAQTRYNVALTLASAGRLPDAREYALAALRNFQTYGASAQKDIQDTLDLISKIAKAAGAG